MALVAAACYILPIDSTVKCLSYCTSFMPFNGLIVVMNATDTPNSVKEIEE